MPPTVPVQVFDASHLKGWVTRAAALLDAASGAIDALNVFPVPDGDTGTNLALTWRAGEEALEELAADPAQLGQVCGAWTRGLLLGARGNSGVILAQMLRGFTEVFEAGDVDAPAMARGFRRAAELAYAGVARPVEGTMLTVADAAAKAAEGATDTSLANVLSAAVEGAADALANTPRQLPVLAQAGVVDAGGQGYVLVIEALSAELDDKPAMTVDETLAVYGLAPHASAASKTGDGMTPGALGANGSAIGAAAHGHIAGVDAGFDAGDGAFEVMYLLEADDADVPGLRSTLDARGDSVVVVGGEGLWNVHVHTDDAGPAIEAGVAVGRVFRIRITQLTPDAEHREHRDHQQAEFGGRPGGQQASHEQTRSIVAVIPGSGAASLFEASGARVVAASAGNRPTPQMLVDAAAGTADVVVLPNDDDHEAVAQAAALEIRTTGRRVAIIPTHSVVQGVAAVAVHDPTRSFTDDVVAMTAAAGATRHGGVAQAEREAMTSAGICRPGEILGLVEGDIALIGADPLSVGCQLVDRMLSAGGEIVTLMWGSDPFDGRELADGVREHLHSARRDVEVTIYNGGQPHYPLLIGVE